MLSHYNKSCQKTNIWSCNQCTFVTAVCYVSDYNVILPC